MNMSEVSRVTAPHPFAYVITQDSDGKLNAMGASWWMFASTNPPMLTLCLNRKKHTIQVIERTMRFSLCLPDVALREQARQVCQTTGAKIDKVAAFSVGLTPGKTGMPVLKQARACFECQVKEIHEAGDHALCLAEILAFSEDPALEALRTTKDGYSL